MIFLSFTPITSDLEALLLFALISFISFNGYIQYYSSQTFTETFFLFLQSICLYVTFRIIDSINKESSLINGFQENYGKWLMFGLLFVLLAISKSIGFESQKHRS